MVGPNKMSCTCVENFWQSRDLPCHSASVGFQIPYCKEETTLGKISWEKSAESWNNNNIMEYIHPNVAYMYNNNSSEQTYEQQNSTYDNQYYHGNYSSELDQDLWSSQSYGNSSEQMQSPGSSIKSKKICLSVIQRFFVFF